MLNLSHLKYFVDAAHSNSLSKAAKLNFVSSSAISQAIKALESSLETTLTTHRRNQFELTEAGRWLVQQSHSLFESTQQLKSQLHDFSHRKSNEELIGKIEIATSHSLAIAILPKLLEQFSQKHPKIQIMIRTGNAIKVRELLQTRQVEMALTLDDGAFAGFSTEAIANGNYVLTGTKPHSTLKKESVFIVGDKGFEVEQLRLEYQKKHKSHLPVRYEVQSWELIAFLCEKELGVGLLPDFILKFSEKKSALKKISHSFHLPEYQMILATRKGIAPTKIAIEFQKNLKNYF